LDGFLELLLSYIAPRAYGIANNFNVESRHCAKGWLQHSSPKESKANAKGERLQAGKQCSCV
jgi:hypothetical protein